MIRSLLSGLFTLSIWTDIAIADVYSFGCGLSAPFPAEPKLLLQQDIPSGGAGKVGILEYGFVDQGRHLFFSGGCTYGVGQDPKDPAGELRIYLRSRAASTGSELVQDDYSILNGRVTGTGVIRTKKDGLVGTTYIVAFYTNRALFNWAVQGVGGVSEKLASEEFKSGFMMVKGK